MYRPANTKPFLKTYLDQLTLGDRIGVDKYTEGDNECSATESNDDSEDNYNQDDEKYAEPKKPKRTRTAFSNQQLDQLELVFATAHYPDVFTREELSRRLCIKEDRIQVSVIFNALRQCMYSLISIIIKLYSRKFSHIDMTQY